MNDLRPVVVITGASSGIGRSLALALAREGGKVGLVARRAELLQSLVEEIRQAGGVAESAVADVAQHAETVAAIRGLADSGLV